MSADLLQLNGNTFCCGRSVYVDTEENGDGIYVQLHIGGDVTTTAKLDTGSDWTVLHPAFLPAGYDALEPAMMSTRFGNVRGNLYRVPITLPAQNGQAHGTHGPTTARTNRSSMRYF